MKNIILIFTFLFQACTPLYAQETGPANSVMRVPSGGGKARMGTINLGAVGTVGTSILGLSNGGSAKALTAVAGGMLYTDADSHEVMAAGTAGQAVVSGGAGAPTWFAPTAGSVLFAGTNGILAQDNTYFYWDSSNNRLGLGVGASGNSFTLNGVSKGSTLTLSSATAGNAAQLTVHRHSNTLASETHYLRSRGTEAAPTVVASGDVLGAISAIGYDATDYEYGAKMSFEVDGTPGDNDMPGRIVFSVVPDGSVTPAEAMRISSTKQVTLAGSLAGPIETDAATTGADQTIGATLMIKRMTNASLASVVGVTAPTSGATLIILSNVTGSDIVIKNDTTATAANRIITGSGSNLTWSNGASLWLAYDSTSSRWRIIGGSGSGSGATVYGSTGSPRSVVAATGIVAASSHMSTTQTDQVIFTVSSVASAITAISANPQIEAHTVVGARMTIWGTSDTDVYELSTGNGLLLNGNWQSNSGSNLRLMWNGTVWAEEGRNSI